MIPLVSDPGTKRPQLEVFCLPHEGTYGLAVTVPTELLQRSEYAWSILWDYSSTANARIANGGKWTRTTRRCFCPPAPRTHTSEKSLDPWNTLSATRCLNRQKKKAVSVSSWKLIAGGLIGLAVQAPLDARQAPLQALSPAGAIGGGIRTMGVLGSEPFRVKLEPNEWFRFDQPGTYQVSVRSRRVTDDVRATSNNQAVVPTESNTLSFEVLPRDRDWEAGEIGAALQVLDSGSLMADGRKACRTLRFLGTDAAVDEMILRESDGAQWGCGFE
jgi:hypothetical protein